MPSLASLHRWIGILAVVAFLLTGQYMDKVHAHLVDTEGVQRMLFRSTHLYILFAGLMNVFLGLSWPDLGSGWPARLQTLGSLVILLVPILLTIGFFVEPFLTDFARPYTRPAAYMSFGGGLLILGAHLLSRRTGSS